MLLDLDELVLRCRDERARTYINEAVSCYNAGAYRSAIVATWIAVAFDIVDKVLELSATGDKGAAALAKELEEHIDANDYQKALGIERTLLRRAKDDFELISQQEYLELERLQQDRHRCAHPTRSSATQIFTPSPELARLHIRNAVECLLQHPPAQGKAALAALFAHLESNYFPQKSEDAYKLLDGSSLKKARVSLVRNFLISLLKKSLEEPRGGKTEDACAIAINYCIDRYPLVAADVLTKELGRLFAQLSTDEQLRIGLKLLCVNKVLAGALVEDQVTRLQEYVRAMPREALWEMDGIATRIGLPRIKEAARIRASRASLEDVEASGMQISLDGLFRPRVISVYSKSASFDDANAWAKPIIDYARSFTSSEIQEILEAAQSNDQIQHSYQYPKVVDAFRKKNSKLPSNFDELVAAVQKKIKPDVVPQPLADFDDDIPF